MQNLDNYSLTQPIKQKQSITKFKVKVFEEDYSHFDTADESDREFLDGLKDLGTLFSEYASSCHDYYDVLRIRKWIHTLCRAGKELSEKRNLLLEILIEQLT